MPKGTVEAGEEYKDTAAREVLEETGVDASIIKYVGKSQYTFNVPEGHRFQGCTLVSDDGGQLLQQSHREKNISWIPDIISTMRHIIC